ncbi:MAG: FAD-binding oxidoreductase [Planctomycetes bacterium]|nr:FAD-binding oxidoreductase [Planctomycetota bacterium]
MRQASYWEQATTPQAAPESLPTSVDVLVVGAGFMGSWLAYFLHRRNPALRVLVLERDGIGYGASSRNAGFLTTGQITEMLEDSRECGFDTVVSVLARRRAGLALVRKEFPGLPVHTCGSTDFDPITDEKRAFAARVNATLGETTFVERQVNLGGTMRPGFCQAADAGVHPLRLLELIRASAGDGFAFAVNVDRIGAGTAHCTTGTVHSQIRYRRAFVCTNGFAAALEPASPVQPGRGQVIVTSRVSTPTDNTLGYLNAGYDYFRFVDGRLLLGGGRNRFRAEEATQEIATTANLLAHLRQTATTILGHERFTVDYHWAGIMGFVGGKHLGGSPRRRMDGTTEAVAGFGGMGVALAPVLALEIAQEF